MSGNYPLPSALADGQNKCGSACLLSRTGQYSGRQSMFLPTYFPYAKFEQSVKFNGRR
jgi:hypothetical protein